ncbi:MAG: flagellar biosynthetic protein FliO [Butyrivibrio sp.]|nr:flagellar biosynthetic protein FliO [Butyrivibrio sp.]
MTLNSVAQFLTVLVIFIAVLIITYFTSRWIAKYQKTQSIGGNIEILETARISNSAYIQITRIGEKYIAYAVSKDTVTKLTDLSLEELQIKDVSAEVENKSFKDVLELLKKQKQ